MKMNKMLTLVCGLALGSHLAAQQPRYELIWQEDFNGSTFDEKYWTKIPRGNADWCRHMSDEPSLYEVKDGNLILRGKVNDGIVPQDTARYITGGLYTKDKKTITHGKVEIKAKLQAAQGAWPAFWMLPNTGTWPNGGEIDIMERLNHDSIAYNPDDYNVYAVEILPDSLVFSINGNHTFTYPRIETDKEGQFPFGTPYYILIDMQIEGSWVGKANPAEYPVEMQIDWVKVYSLKP